uniref:dual specificity phosphatase 28-like n=1 Tax=Myxine glutinosa TaxID=7769 RepID=UPI00358F8D83
MQRVLHVCDGLRIGTARLACQADLHEEAITLLLNITRQQPFPKVLPPGMRCMRVSLSDLPHEPLLEHLTPCVEAIEDECRRGGCTLVYCKNGRSRSASVCLAYLMHDKGLSLSDALQKLKSIRPGVCPNEGFWEQLQIYEKRIKNTDAENISTVLSQ